MSNNTDFHQEWQSLHRSYDQYESYGLIIKLTAIILFFLSFALNINPFVTLPILLILWLQEGIWKTFQSRTEQRLFIIEALIIEPNHDSAFQFYSEWESKRPNTSALIKTYITQALRPTVAYPYIILVIISLFLIS